MIYITITYIEYVILIHYNYVINRIKPSFDDHPFPLYFVVLYN